MKLDKTNVYVYIENEAQLNEARELLEKYGEQEGENEQDMLFVYAKSEHHFLTFSKSGYWWMARIKWRPNLITLPELETILKSNL